jgi:hypothetical protein
MIVNNRNACTQTNWNTLSPVAKALVHMFAASPIWRITAFQRPSAELLDESLAAAWDRAGFSEEELRASPEIVVGALKKFVGKHLQAN